MSAFLNPHLLWGLLLVAAPIIIHLLNKRRFEIHPWAAMDFLLKADVQNRRRLRLEDLLLLLLRAGLIAAGVFLVARPVVEGWGGLEEGVRTVLIDDSASMDYRGGGQSSLERARDQAVHEVEVAVASGARVSARRGTRPAIELGSVEGPISSGTLSSGPVSGGTVSSGPVPGGPASEEGEGPAERQGAESAARLLFALRSLEASDGVLRLAEALELEAREIEEERGVEQRALYLVSDFRRSDWLERSGELRPRLREAFDRLKKAGGDRLRLRLIPVGGTGRENCAPVRLSADTPQPIAGLPVTLVVEVRNFGSEERRGLSGELEVGDPSSPAHRIPLPAFPTIPPGGSASVELEHTFPAAGEYPLAVRLDSDLLARDDRAYAVVVVRDALNVLVVDGDPGPDRLSGESGFLAAALAPRGSAATGVRPQVALQPVTETLLEGRDVVLLLNCAEVSAAERGVLERFVKAGGGLGFFLGSRVRPQVYTEVLGSAGIFPAVLRAPVESREGVRLDFGRMEHPTLRVYQGLRDASVERVTSARYFDLEAAGGGVVVAASYADAPRTPAILERVLGGGRVALFNLSADRDWTDWPTDPSYPVVCLEWVRHLAPRRGEGLTLRVGEAFSLPASGAAVEVTDPRGTRTPAAAEGGLARFEKTERAGIYRTEGGGDAAAAGGSAAGGTAASVHWFAVNRVPEESDLTPAEEGELRRVLASTGIPFGFREAEQVETGAERGGDLWRWLALSAGLLLLAELGAAYWIGRR